MGTTLKALKLLDCFSSSLTEIGLSQLSRMSGTNKATVLRHLRELEEFGLIEQNPNTKSYAIGPVALRLAALREMADPGLDSARQKVQSAVNECGESLHLSLLQRSSLNAVLVVETKKHSIRVSLDPAEIHPFNATASGLAVLSFGPDHLFDDLIEAGTKKFTEHTLTAPDLIRQRMDQIRKFGWSRSNNGYEVGVHGFAAPVFGIDEVAIGAISIAVPSSRVTEAQSPLLLRTLNKVSQELTLNFGGQRPARYPSEFQLYH